ncbi:MAG: DEAD/DEAH box helicase [Vicinamibacterales bacterium]
MPFASLGLSPRVTSPLARLGYTTPTPVQAATIPPALAGRDVLARAQTGTGKTAAFGLPMIDRLQTVVGASPRPRGLVLVPTRELALQVHDALRTLAQGTRLRGLALVGGEALMPQVRGLRRGVDIVVATPGRLIDHLDRRTIDLSAIEIVVLDEADRMLDMGFLPPLKQIMTTVPAGRQTLMLSATLSSGIVDISATFMRDPVRVDVAPEHVVAATVVHRVYAVAQEQKKDLLTHVLAAAPARQTLVFCRTKHGSDRVGRHLEGAGLRTAVIHGDKTQGARKRALGDFKTGRVSVLVATDVAARGLDIERLPLVVNYDLPLVPQDYVHRVGRTGRAGQAGEAISLATHAERGLLKDIQRLLPSPIERGTLPEFAASVAGVRTARGRDEAPARVDGFGRRQAEGRSPAPHRTGRFGRPGPRPHRKGQRRFGQSERPLSDR